MAKNQKELLEDLIEEIAKLKQGLPNGNIIRIEQTIKAIQDDIREIKKTILDPENGIVVKVNKNTEFREERTNRLPFYEDKINQFENLKAWKNTISRALWVIYSAIIGLLIKILFFNN